VDLVCLSYDGNVLDAALLAVNGALKDSEWIAIVDQGSRLNTLAQLACLELPLMTHCNKPFAHLMYRRKSH